MVSEQRMKDAELQLRYEMVDGRSVISSSDVGEDSIVSPGLECCATFNVSDIRV